MKKNLKHLYTTEIRGTTKVHTSKSDYVIKMETEVVFKGNIGNTTNERYIIRELSYELEQYEDPVMVQIVELTNKVASIYKELDVEVNMFGLLVKINNSDEIRKKWQEVKDWLTRTHPLESYEVIRAKEFELKNSEMEKKNVKYIHFLHQFFYVHNRHKKAMNGVGMFSLDEMDRFGAGIVLPVSVRYKIENMDNTLTSFKNQFNTRFIKSEDVVNRLSKFAKQTLYNPKFHIEGDYDYKENTLQKAELTITEELGENYYNHSYLSTKLKE